MLAGAAVLSIAAWLEPDAAGLGTHTQLGWAPCGFEMRTGLPCATCGMTTATTLAAEGRFLSSLRTQPAGFLFALSSAIVAIMGAWSLWTGRSLGPVIRAVARPKTLLIIGALVIAAWAYRLTAVLTGQGWTTL